MNDLKNKTLVLGVTGSIAAYKACDLVSRLVKTGLNVEVIMTNNATHFVSPEVFDTLTGNRCMVETFDRNHAFNVEHIALAKRANLFMVAPASANFIAKAANGLADDMLTTTFLAASCPKIVAPAMNTAMYLNPITQDNIKKLESYGIDCMSPALGRLACGDQGLGKLPEVDRLFDEVLFKIAYEKDLIGKKILVTAGPTQERIDPVRYLTNHSSGKMGYAIAKIAAMRGADVTLVAGPTALKDLEHVNIVHIESAKEMYDEVKKISSDCDLIVKAAAVADYRPKTVYDNKVKKSDDELSIELERTDDILAYLGEHKKEGQCLIGFSMETQDMLENSKKKLEKKKLDMIVANNLKVKGAGFGTDTNVVTLISKDRLEELPLMSKEDVADRILTEYTDFLLVF